MQILRLSAWENVYIHSGWPFVCLTWPQCCRLIKRRSCRIYMWPRQKRTIPPSCWIKHTGWWILILPLSSTAAATLGKGMAEMVVAQSHLWLTLTELPWTPCFFTKPLSLLTYLGQALDKIQPWCNQRKKQEEVLRMNIPWHCYAQPKQPSAGDAPVHIPEHNP